MKLLMVASAVAAIALTPGAFAQNQTSNSQATSQPSASSSEQNIAAAQKIQQDLKKSGFTDVKVVAESFVVQAKTKDGDPVVMTIGPHGMSVFEAINANASSKSNTTGSATGSQGTSSK